MEEKKLEELFCPLIKEKCKGAECVFCIEAKEGEGKLGCLKALYLHDKLVVMNQQGEGESDGNPFREEEPLPESEIPEKLKTASAEELAEELFTYFNEDGGTPEFLKSNFWEEKEVYDSYLMPKEIRRKIRKAEIIAEKRQAKFEEEKVPELKSAFIEWAKEKKIPHNIFSLKDLALFLKQRKIGLSEQNRRDLFITAKNELANN